MIPASFDYELAESVEHALELLGSREDAKLLAGGHSLVPLLKLRFVRPAVLVDVGRLGDLAYVREDGDRIAIGALTTHHALVHDSILKEHCPLLSYTASLVGDPQVRHRGTIGGSAAHGDPASDLPTALVALDAELVIRGADGERTVGAQDFFRSVFETAVGPAEMLTELRVPRLAGVGWSYLKFVRRAQDWATVGVAAVTRNGGGAIALTNMGPVPVRAHAAEQALASGGPEAAGEAGAEGSDPQSDASASADFRRHLARVLVRRAVEEARSR